MVSRWRSGPRDQGSGSRLKEIRMDAINAVSRAPARCTIINTASAAILCLFAFLPSAGDASSADRPVSPDVPRRREVVSVHHENDLGAPLLRRQVARRSRRDARRRQCAYGAVYPPGSVIQLIPGEAMVKRSKGFSPATHDWEFFELDVSKDGTDIRRRDSLMSAIDSAGTALDATLPLVPSGISFAKPTTTARRSH